MKAASLAGIFTLHLSNSWLMRGPLNASTSASNDMSIPADIDSTGIVMFVIGDKGWQQTWNMAEQTHDGQAQSRRASSHIIMWPNELPAKKDEDWQYAARLEMKAKMKSRKELECSCRAPMTRGQQKIWRVALALARSITRRISGQSGKSELRKDPRDGTPGVSITI